MRAAFALVAPGPEGEEMKRVMYQEVPEDTGVFFTGDDFWAALAMSSDEARHNVGRVLRESDAQLRERIEAFRRKQAKQRE